MQNPSTDDKHSAYYDAVSRADLDLDEALSHIRAEEDAGRITPVEAAAERVGLLERHLERCRQLRAEHLGSLGRSRPTARTRWTAGSDQLPAAAEHCGHAKTGRHAEQKP